MCVCGNKIRNWPSEFFEPPSKVEKRERGVTVSSYTVCAHPRQRIQMQVALTQLARRSVSLSPRARDRRLPLPPESMAPRFTRNGDGENRLPSDGAGITKGRRGLMIIRRY